MMDTAQSRHVLQPFVRGELGCACPDEVFADIAINSAPPGMPAGWLIGLGGRLLLMIPAAGVRPIASHDLEGLLRRGRALREAGGFHRFRLVLPQAGTSPTQRPPALAEDDRLHLHRIDSARLAALQRWLRDRGC